MIFLTNALLILCVKKLLLKEHNIVINIKCKDFLSNFTKDDSLLIAKDFTK